MKCIFCNNKLVGPESSSRQIYLNNSCGKCGLTYGISVRMNGSIEYDITIATTYKMICRFIVTGSGELELWEMEAEFKDLKLHDKWAAKVVIYKLTR